MQSSIDADVHEIRELIARQFRSMSWAEGSAPDWTSFNQDFLPGALLYPAARPAKPQTLSQFAERMSSLVGSTLHSFDETVLGSTVRVYGNVAVAAVACENRENTSSVNRNVEMMLLVKTDGNWRIAAQAWDREDAANPLTPAVWQDA